MQVLQTQNQKERERKYLPTWHTGKYGQPKNRDQRLKKKKNKERKKRTVLEKGKYARQIKADQRKVNHASCSE
jgi:hypothetical protein